MFTLMWLSQLVPAAITKTVPAELAATGLPSNPVHVIDLTFILPLYVITGVLTWRGHARGLVLAPVLLVFGTLMASSIMLLTAMQAGGVHPIAIAMGVLAGLHAMLATSVLRRDVRNTCAAG